MISLELKKQKDPSKIGKTDLPNQKVEVTINHAFKDIRYGLWINPNSKVTRYRPVDFGENGVQVELPRALQMSTLIMRVFWNARDTFSKPDVYSKDIILVPNIGLVLEPTNFLSREVSWTSFGTLYLHHQSQLEIVLYFSFLRSNRTG